MPAPGPDNRHWWLKYAPIDDLRLLVANGFVELRPGQKKEIEKWRNQENYDPGWLIVCEGEINADKNSAMFIANGSNDLLTISWPTLEAANFRHMYKELKDPLEEDEFGEVCLALVRHTLTEEGVPEEDIKDYITWLGNEIELMKGVMKDAPPKTVSKISDEIQHIWTSAAILKSAGHKMDGIEFCSILNHTIRSRDYDIIGMKHAVRIVRTMNNEFNVNARYAREIQVCNLKNVIPPELITYRGGALPLVHREFFSSKANAEGDAKKYRAPMGLATTSDKDIATNFMNERGSNVGVLWKFHFPQGEKATNENGIAVIRGCCLHVNKIRTRMIGVEEEFEWVIPPFSAFSVRSFEENAPEGCCVVELDVCPDGQAENDSLPNAPWH
jgi:hypothetical protein